MFHGDLDRFLASDMADYLEVGATPKVKSLAEQRRTLRPLRQMMELAGFQCDDAPDVALRVVGPRASIDVGSYPSVLEALLSEHPLGTRGAIFSEFAIQRNLPGIFAQLENELR
jgi:hypothetical protein